jgi:heat shock protein HslJ
MRKRVAVLLVLAAACRGSMRKQSRSLERTAWVAQDVDGHGVVARVQSTIAFGGDGQANGNGGCNRYRTTATLGKDTIALGPIAATRMACPPPIMEQEQRFLAALATVRRYEIDRGMLVLRDQDGAARVRLAPLEKS